MQWSRTANTKYKKVGVFKFKFKKGAGEEEAMFVLFIKSQHLEGDRCDQLGVGHSLQRQTMPLGENCLKRKSMRRKAGLLGLACTAVPPAFLHFWVREFHCTKTLLEFIILKFITMEFMNQ